MVGHEDKDGTTGDWVDLREIIRPSPRRCIFYIVVARHVFGSDSDLVIGMLGE